MRSWFALILIIGLGCSTTKSIEGLPRSSSLGGAEFYRVAAGMKWGQRDSFAVAQLMAGDMPAFLMKFQPVNVSVVDSATGKRVEGTYYVSPDYLSIGTDADWARIPLTPMAAQRVADALDCFLPTRKIVNDIYLTAAVKLEPVPMYAFRDSTPTFWQHHLIIEGQRQGRKGLIAGIKKDVVISGKISRDGRANREAIYGWHRLDGNPIQPLYTGHINWWVDYSHGIRLIYRKIKINRQWVDYKDVLKHPVWRRLLCDEEWCDYYRYDY